MYLRCASFSSPAARSAFKLLQIQRAFDIFRDVRSVVDLCAAPGGWTEVLSQQLAGQSASASTAAATATATADGNAAAASAGPVRIVAVDLQAMAPLPGVHFIQGDLTRAVTATLILDALGRDECDDASAAPMDTDAGAAGSVSSVAGSAAIPAPSHNTLSDSVAPRGSQRLAELVVCDGAPDVIGMHDIDEAVQHELTLSALNIALHILRPCTPSPNEHTASAATSASDAPDAAAAASPGPPLLGCFVAKLFRGRRVSLMYALMQKYFHRVSISKPKSCRTSSVEGFVVCQGYRGLAAVGEEGRAMEDALALCEAEGLPLAPVPFVSCWDEEGLDSDRSYPLSYTFLALRGTGAVGGGGDGDGSGRTGTGTAGGAAAAASAGGVPVAAAASSGYQHLAPSAMPIDPPYLRSLQIKRQNNKVH